MNQGNREAIAKLAQSGEAQRLMKLLNQSGSVQQEAQDAAGGKPEALIARMQQLMSTEEGARLVEQINRKARQNGLSK